MPNSASLSTYTTMMRVNSKGRPYAKVNANKQSVWKCLTWIALPGLVWYLFSVTDTTTIDRSPILVSHLSIHIHHRWSCRKSRQLGVYASRIDTKSAWRQQPHSDTHHNHIQHVAGHGKNAGPAFHQCTALWKCHRSTESSNERSRYLGAYS